MKKHKKRIFTLVFLFTVATVIIHIVNKVVAASACVKGMLDKGVKKYYHWRLGNVYYQKKGEGSPILLIHDMLPGGCTYEWDKIEDELAKSYTVYNLDLLGCGRSEKQQMIYTNFVYVQMIADFIHDVIGEKTDVIVSGYSSSFVVMANLNEENLFGKIMMVNPSNLNSLKKMPEMKDRILKKILEVPVFGTLIYHMVVSREEISNLFIENMFFDPFHLDEEFLDAYYEASHHGGAYAKTVYVNYASKFMNISIDRGVQKLDVPVMIVEGQAENNGKAIVADYRKLNESIEAVTIASTKHFPHLEDPEAFLDQVEKFF